MGITKLAGNTAKIANLMLGSTQITASGADLNTILGSSAANRRTRRTVAIPLAGPVNTGGGLGVFLNPEGVAIIIERLEIDVTTIANAACTVAAGTTAVSATTSSNNLIDALDVRSATGQFDNITNKGAAGKTTGKLAAAGWVTFTAGTGASAGLVAVAYLTYLRV